MAIGDDEVLRDVDVFNFGGKRSLAAGVAVSLASAVAPMVLGSGADPAEINLLDGAAWLASEGAADVVRVNGETGRVDARIDLGQVATDLVVEQAGDTVLVNVAGQLRRIDVANLDWGASVGSDGEIVVGDDTVYLVRPEGVVRQLDPTSLETEHEVDLGATPGHGVIAAGHLVVPLDDGTVAVVDGDDVVGEVEAGDAGDRLHVSRVGERVAVLNQARGAVRTFDATNGEASDEHEVDLPEGELAVPRELPDGPLWVTAVRSGELAALDIESGEGRLAPVAEGGHALTAPAAVGERVYLVDRTAGHVISVDAASLGVLRREPLGLPDASHVELVAHGGKAYVNDRAGNLAVVIDGDEYRRVDKYTNEGVATPTPPTDLPDPGPAPSPHPGAAPQAPAPGPQGGPVAPAPTTAPQPTTAPPTPPPAPTAVTATAGNASATVGWAAGSGGTAAASFRVTHDGLDRPLEVPGDQLSTTVEDLSNGDPYTFEVWAVNAQGESERVASNEVVPADEVPGRPENAAATSEASEEAVVTWDAADGRGNDIAGYVVTTSPGDVRTEVAGDGTSATIEGLTNDTPYTFTVTAVNDLGIESEPSDPTEPVTPVGPPGAITGLTAAAGPGSAGLTWNPAPSSLPVAYRVTASPAAGPDPEPFSTPTYSYTGLENGVNYTFTVTPVNDRGDGPSVQVTATPGQAPAVTGVSAERTGDRTFRVTFGVDNGGYPVTGCSLTVGNQAVSCSVDGNQGSGSVDVPTYSTGYTFRASVSNQLGSSSGETSGTSAGKPLTVDATSQDRWDGACTWQERPRTRPYYGTPNHACGTASGYIADRETVRAECWTTGGEIRDDLLHYSNVWIRVTQGYMNTLYFLNWDANPESDLPRC